MNEIHRLVEQIENNVNEAIIILDGAMSRLPDVACKIKAPLDGKLAMSFAELMQVKKILRRIVE